MKSHESGQAMTEYLVASFFFLWIGLELFKAWAGNSVIDMLQIRLEERSAATRELLRKPSP